jgi:beta-glucosidase
MARMAVAFVRGLQGDHPRYLKFIATPKHFAVHSGPDDIRDRFNAVVNDRDLWDTYLPAFEASVKEGGAFAVSGHYSAVNGVPACMNQRLLTDILRTKWGFRGYAISDAGAMDTAVSSLKYVPSRAESVSRALKAGLDLDLWGDSYRDALGGAIKSGLLTEKDVDRALLRLLEARLRLGQFDPPEQVPWTRLPIDIVNGPPHRALALEAARKSIVLLKNAGGLLPLDRQRLKTVALIGPHAATTPRGIYSGIPRKPVSLLEGILRKLPSEVRLLHAEGCSLQSTMELVPASAFILPEDRPGQSPQPGLRAEFFANAKLEGNPALVRTEATPDVPERLASPAPGLPVPTSTFRPSNSICSKPWSVWANPWCSSSTVEVRWQFRGLRNMCRPWCKHGIPAKRAAAPSPTYSSATLIPAGGCPSRSTLPWTTCRRSRTTPCPTAPIVTLPASPCMRSAMA